MAVTVKKLANPWAALGMAANFLARREPFAGFPARDLVRTLTAQAERGHYLFALDATEEPARIVGYCGWALLSHAAADRIVATGIAPDITETGTGDVIWIFTGAAATRAAFFALVRETKRLHPDHRVMGIRHRNGRRVVFDSRRDNAT